MQLADPAKFTTIAYASHRYRSPLGSARAAGPRGLLPLHPGVRILDIGWGWAPFLLDVPAALGARDSVRDAGRRCGRHTLGFGFHLLLKPTPVE